jgi:hypothetical protein
VTRPLLLWQIRWLFYFRMLDRLHFVVHYPDWAASERAWAAHNGVECALRDVAS